MRHRTMMIESIPGSILIIDRNWHIVAANQQALRSLGQPGHAWVGRDLWASYPGLPGSPLESTCRQVMQSRETVHLEVETILQPGWCTAAVFPTREGIGLLWMEAARRTEMVEQAHLLIIALEAAANGVVITDRNGQMEWANPAFSALTGYSTNEALGKNPRELVKSGLYGKEFYQNLWTTILSGQVWQCEMINRRKDGSLYTEEMTITPVSDQSGEIRHFVAIKQDISRRKAAEEEALAGAVQIELQHRLLEQREQERIQIARHLHDGPTQELIGALYTLQHAIETNRDPSVQADLETLKETLHQQISELRAYAGELRPPTLDRFGLVTAIQAHAEVFQEKHPGLTIELDNLTQPEGMHKDADLALFRIYQEALTNIAKHSHASHVQVRVFRSEGDVVLEIEDNGVGFETTENWLGLARQGHLGLVGMRERAEAVSGRMEIFSGLNGGTCIRVNMPYSPEG